MGVAEEKVGVGRNLRKWTGWFLGAAVALQFYFVQEMVAALALFAIAFAAVALVVLSLYGLQKVWEMAVTRVFGLDQMATRGLPARDLRLNGQVAAPSKLPQELKIRNRNSKDGRSWAAVDWGVGQRAQKECELFTGGARLF